MQTCPLQLQIPGLRTTCALLYASQVPGPPPAYMAQLQAPATVTVDLGQVLLQSQCLACVFIYIAITCLV